MSNKNKKFQRRNSYSDSFKRKANPILASPPSPPKDPAVISLEHSLRWGPGKAGDLTPELILWWKIPHLPHAQPGTCVSAGSYATLTEFPIFFWQVEKGTSKEPVK